VSVKVIVPLPLLIVRRVVQPPAGLGAIWTVTVVFGEAVIVKLTVPAVQTGLPRLGGEAGPPPPPVVVKVNWVTEFIDAPALNSGFAPFVPFALIKPIVELT
jgi:hypothetical protein